MLRAVRQETTEPLTVADIENGLASEGLVTSGLSVRAQTSFRPLLDMDRGCKNKVCLVIRSWPCADGAYPQHTLS